MSANLAPTRHYEQCRAFVHGVFHRQRQQCVPGDGAQGRIGLSELDEARILRAVRCVQPAATSVALFGSVLRGDTDALSDTDVLVFVPGLAAIQRGVYAVEGMLLDIHAVDAGPLAARMHEEVRTRLAFYISLLDDLGALHVIGDATPWQQSAVLASQLFRNPPPITTWEPLLTSLTRVVRKLGRIDDACGYFTMIVALRRHLLTIMCLHSCGWIARESTMAEFVRKASPVSMAQLDAAFEQALGHEPAALLALAATYLDIVGGPKPPKQVGTGRDG